MWLGYVYSYTPFVEIETEEWKAPEKRYFGDEVFDPFMRH